MCGVLWRVSKHLRSAWLINNVINIENSALVDGSINIGRKRKIAMIRNGMKVCRIVEQVDGK